MARNTRLICSGVYMLRCSGYLRCKIEPEKMKQKSSARCNISAIMQKKSEIDSLGCVLFGRYDKVCTCACARARRRDDVVFFLSLTSTCAMCYLRPFLSGGCNILCVRGCRAGHEPGRTCQALVGEGVTLDAREIQNRRQHCRCTRTQVLVVHIESVCTVLALKPEPILLIFDPSGHCMRNVSGHERVLCIRRIIREY